MRPALKFAVLVLALLLIPGTAQAYVDPGIMSVLFQALYVIFFGAAATFILRPWAYLKSLFKRSEPDAVATPERDTEEPE